LPFIVGPRAESKSDQTQPDLEIQKPPSSLLSPDLSCYFEKGLNTGSIWIWIQNNTPGKANNFSIHVEAVGDGAKVFDRVFSGSNLSGNDKAPLDLIPCKPGQKFTGIVDFGESIAETNETNNTFTYNCDGLMHIINLPIEKNINPVIPRVR